MCEEEYNSYFMSLIEERLFEKSGGTKSLPKVLAETADCILGGYYTDNSDLYKLQANERDICDRIYNQAIGLSVENKKKVHAPCPLSDMLTLRFTVNVIELLYRNNQWDPEYKEFSRNTLMNCLFCLNPYILWDATERELRLGDANRDPEIVHAIRNVLELYILADKISSRQDDNRGTKDSKHKIWLTYNNFHHIFEIERAVCDPFDMIHEADEFDNINALTELGIVNFTYFMRKLNEYRKTENFREEELRKFFGYKNFRYFRKHMNPEGRIIVSIM